MASTYTTRNRLEKQGSGENEDTWGTRLNERTFDMMDEAMDGYLSKSVAGAADVTLTENNGLTDESRNRFIVLTGLLTGNINVIVPTAERWWYIHNNSTGAFTITVKTSAGTGVVIDQGATAILYCDGTNVEYLSPVQGWGAEEYIAVAGTDTYTATLVPAPNQLQVGACVTGVFTNANTTAATLNVNGLGAVTIVRDGAALTGGEIKANGVYRLMYDGSNWNLMTITILSADVLDAGTAITANTGTSGTALPFLDGANTFSGNNTFSGTSDFTGGILENGTNLLLKNFLQGFEMNTNLSDSEHDIDVAAGICRDSGNDRWIELTSALVKRMDAAWAVGTNAGALDGTEAVAGTPDASTWFYVYAIMRSDTGVVDVCLSTSASAPLLDGTAVPVEYDYYRRIGAVLFDASSNQRPFLNKGARFWWYVPIIDGTVTSTGSRTGVTLTVPQAIDVLPLTIYSIYGANATFYGVVTTSAMSDIAPTASVYNARSTGTTGGQNSDLWCPYVITDGALYGRVTGSSMAFITCGWVDLRGQSI